MQFLDLSFSITLNSFSNDFPYVFFFRPRSFFHFSPRALLWLSIPTKLWGGWPNIPWCSGTIYQSLLVLLFTLLFLFHSICFDSSNCSRFNCFFHMSNEELNWYCYDCVLSSHVSQTVGFWGHRDSFISVHVCIITFIESEFNTPFSIWDRCDSSVIFSFTNLCRKTGMQCTVDGRRHNCHGIWWPFWQCFWSWNCSNNC